MKRCFGSPTWAIRWIRPSPRCSDPGPEVPVIHRTLNRPCSTRTATVALLCWRVRTSWSRCSRNAPLEKWRVFLHPSQAALVKRNFNGPRQGVSAAQALGRPS